MMVVNALISFDLLVSLYFWRKRFRLLIFSTYEFSRNGLCLLNLPHPRHYVFVKNKSKSANWIVPAGTRTACARIVSLNAKIDDRHHYLLHTVINQRMPSG
jgi:hypothetical protein